MLYSKSTNGFYDPTINFLIPTDAVLLSTEIYHQMIEGQSKGFQIIAADNGFPKLVARPEQTNEQIKQTNKKLAMSKLIDTSWSQAIDVNSNLENYEEFRLYRLEIINILKNPEITEWPSEPIPKWK